MVEVSFKFQATTNYPIKASVERDHFKVYQMFFPLREKAGYGLAGDWLIIINKKPRKYTTPYKVTCVVNVSGKSTRIFLVTKLY